ncbi:hypothetical protein J8L85_15640 [Maribacter sp. MMG018]|uniref:hypothetical protein n=1 Tax=Maribacter sp. MMG018 TaxID=2822688 RepID=UPI001B390444|nr:hypothetical protein [Maribacter sp. MMG018]MBQ4915888.1 hypothetical protein [Maribacter sp. MMG018]
MIIGSKSIISVLLVFVFMMGLVKTTMAVYSDDTSIVMELEHHDSQNDSEPEPDIDEDILDLDIPFNESLLAKNFLMVCRFDISLNLDFTVQRIGTSQPTPPPKHIG